MAKIAGYRSLVSIMLLLVVIAGLLSACAQSPADAATSGFADPAFQRIWERTDKPVADGAARRGFYWGPAPGDTRQEQYAEGEGGSRLVQYFDKSRMELNNPQGDKSNPFYVTNGLLTVELVTGALQVGNNRTVTRAPAEIPLASDIDDASAPTYATFTNLRADSSNLTGRGVQSVVTRAGKAADEPALGGMPGAKLTYFEPLTHHNIPDIFWQFLNASGPVYSNGKLITERLLTPWFYSSGYPITEAYWTRVKIVGRPNTLVLVQLYQRRVLTYVPDAPEGFRVQVGNIGQHYFTWRYSNAGKPVPTATAPKTPPAPLPTLGPTGLSVFAASSLKEAFTEAGQSFRAANPNVTDVRFNFQGSQALESQLQQGAPADIFASADKANMDKAVQAGLIEGAPKELAKNSLVVVLPDENFGNIATLKDLARRGIKLSLADKAVPVGAYTLQALNKLSADPAYGSGYQAAVLNNVVSYEDNVRQVLTRVQLGEVDAGIVYVTDAAAANAAASGSAKPVKTLTIPASYNVAATYYIAVAKGAQHPAAAQAWISLVTSGAGQAILRKYGFGAVTP